jgi:hypothetical protein
MRNCPIGEEGTGVEVVIATPRCHPPFAVTPAGMTAKGER